MIVSPRVLKRCDSGFGHRLECESAWEDRMAGKVTDEQVSELSHGRDPGCVPSVASLSGPYQVGGPVTDSAKVSEELIGKEITSYPSREDARLHFVDLIDEDEGFPVRDDRLDLSTRVDHD